MSLTRILGYDHLFISPAYKFVTQTAYYCRITKLYYLNTLSTYICRIESLCNWKVVFMNSVWNFLFKDLKTDMQVRSG